MVLMQAGSPGWVSPSLQHWPETSFLLLANVSDLEMLPLTIARRLAQPSYPHFRLQEVEECGTKQTVNNILMKTLTGSYTCSPQLHHVSQNLSPVATPRCKGGWGSRKGKVMVLVGQPLTSFFFPGSFFFFKSSAPLNAMHKIK